MANQLVPMQRRTTVGTGNQAVALVNAIRLSTAQVINEANQANLQLPIDIGTTPEFLRLKIVWITSLFENAEADQAQAATDLLRQAIGEEFDNLDGILEDEGLMREILARCLFKLLCKAKPGYFTTLMIVNSLLKIMCSNFYTDMNALLDNADIDHQDCSMIEFIALYPEIALCEPFDLRDYKNLNPSHYIFGLCILLNLIGKGLTANNYTGWMTQRTRSYSVPLGLKETDPKLKHLRPSQTVAIQFNAEVKIYWRIRRLYFRYIWSMHKGEDLLAQGARICVNLLRFSEMTNVSMIFLWILTLNEILLGWAELAKFVPHLCAAYAKYQQLGSLAPWAKLILPPDEVQEFNAEKLKTLFSVAHLLG